MSPPHSPICSLSLSLTHSLAQLFSHSASQPVKHSQSPTISYLHSLGARIIIQQPQLLLLLLLLLMLIFHPKSSGSLLFHIIRYINQKPLYYLQDNRYLTFNYVKDDRNSRSTIQCGTQIY